MAVPETKVIPIQLTRMVATGIQGKVYEAKRTDTNKTIAVKCILLDMDPPKRAAELRLLTEQLEIIKTLNHPNLVPHIHSQEASSGTGYEAPTYQIIMEYCPGPTLHDLISRFRITPVLLQKWTRELVDGISYLHEQHCVHRDVKGSNILMSSADPETCHVKIADLGDVKRLLKEATQTKEVSHRKGTWAFMSPEMITDEQIQDQQKDVPETKIKLGRRTDIWSLGCVVIEMVNGTLPEFYKKGSDGKPAKITGDTAVMYFVGFGGSPTIPDKLPDKVNDFIQKCLNRNPSDRPAGVDLKTHPFLTAREQDVIEWTLPPRLV